MYELIIIGAGPGGITSAVYAARKGINFIVISQDVGGQTAWSGDVENYTGYQFITGPQLTQKFEEHMRQFNVELKSPESVKRVENKADVISVATDKDSYETKSLIIASGKQPRFLNVPGEEQFKNRGISYCATCDAPLFREKNVAVIGGGNSALDATLQLIKIAEKIYLININPQLGGDAIMRQKVEASQKVQIFNLAKTKEISGDKFVKAIKLEKDNKEISLDVQGIFVEIGSIPSCNFIDFVEKNKYGEIIIDAQNQTSAEGIFACGDVTNVLEKQIIIAAGEGAKAVLSAFRYLSQKK
ncbi:MAG: FAD-dependent oxidoreductase [Candidatus Omnitrophota bacterium]|nr:FAD-dependent oxidoreductase [Candidatus Omnitrophota bacterium]